MLANFKAYQLALTLNQECQGIKAKGYIQDQLLRASLSIVLNLAEGSAKSGRKDRCRFYEIAFGSTREVQAIVSVLSKGKAIALADQTAACVFALIRSLK